MSSETKLVMMQTSIMPDDCIGMSAVSRRNQQWSFFFIYTRHLLIAWILEGTRGAFFTASQ